MPRVAAFVALLALAVPMPAAAANAAPAPQRVLVYGDSVVSSGAMDIAARLSADGWAPEIVSYPGADVGQVAGNVLGAPNMSDVVVLGVGYTYFWKPYVLRHQIDATMHALVGRGVRR